MTRANQEPAMDETAGAVDNEFDDAALEAKELVGPDDDVQTEPIAGGLAFDLVTRQPLFVRRIVADTVVEYYDDEEFDLANYKCHPYLPVREDDTVYECVFVSEITADDLHNWDSSNTYDYPRGRLAHVPIEEAWAGDDDE